MCSTYFCIKIDNYSSTYSRTSMARSPLESLVGWLVVLGETVFQSISGRLPERGRKSIERIEESKNVQTTPSALEVYPGPPHHPTTPLWKHENMFETGVVRANGCS